MATLSDLVSAIAQITGLPEATVFAYGRFARQAGLIEQKGRGRSAANMSRRDAANLLIAIGAAGVTREAGPVVQAFRSLKRGRFYDFTGGRLPLQWLSKHGVVPFDEPGTGGVKLQGDFGSFFEFLMESVLNGALARALARVPVAEIPSDLWWRWKKDKSPHLNEDLDLLITKGLIKQKAPAELTFGEDLSVEIRFSRLVPAVEVEFMRMWDSPQVAFVATFGPERGAQSRGAHDLRLVATLTQHVLAAAGLVVSDQMRPTAFRTYKAIDSMFRQQFHSLAKSG